MTGELAAIVAFNTARLDEDEAAACAATPGPWEFEGDDPTDDELFTVHEDDPAAGVCFGDPVAYTRGERPWPVGRQVANGQFMERYDPVRALREVAAKRRIVARHHADEHGMCAGCPVDTAGDPEYAIDECPEQRDVAGIWSDHPDYQEGWKP